MNGDGPGEASSSLEPEAKTNGSPGTGAVRENGTRDNHGSGVDSGTGSSGSSSGAESLPTLGGAGGLGNGDGAAAVHVTENGGGVAAEGASLHAAGQNGVAGFAMDVAEEEPAAAAAAPTLAAAAPLPPPARRGWRVKLYQLNGDGQWDDRGTGHVVCRPVEALGGPALVVSSEGTDAGELLCSRVSDDDIYTRQGENIITWCEPPASAGGTASAAAGIDLALSFQENEGCVEVWNRICDVQGRFGGGVSGGGSGAGGREAALPEPRLDNLQAIAEALAALSPVGKDAATQQVLADDGAYLRRLLAVFSDAEDLEDAEGLRALCGVMKHIVALNDQQLLELVLSDRLFVEIAGVFEYDPELRRPAKHREFLTKMARFRQVLPIEGADVVARIHQNFRIAFLKDMLLRPMLDDAIVITLGNMTFVNSTEIVTALGAEGDYAKRVFLLLEQPGLPRERRAEALAFLKELFAMARTVQITTREQFYRHLWTQAPLFSVFVPILKDSSAAIAERSACMDVLLSALAHDPGLLRLHIIKRGSHPPPPPPHAAGAAGGSSGSGGAGSNAGAASGRGTLLSAGSGASGAAEDAGKVARSVRECESILFWLLRRLATDSDLGVLVQATEVIKLLLDTESMETQSDRDGFLGPFYEHYVYWLAEPLGEVDSPTSAASSSTSGAQPPVSVAQTAGAAAAAGEAATAVGAAAAAAGAEESDAAKASKGHACELLSFCVRAHTYRMKYFVLRNGVVMRVLKLLRYRDRFLQLAAVRFLRSCVGMKDEFYNRYIAKNNLLAPLVNLLRESGDRDNLINSAIIELIEFVRAENIRSLVDYLCERRLEPPTGTSLGAVTFAGLRRRYEQNHDSSDARGRDEDLGSAGSGSGGSAAGGGTAPAGEGAGGGEGGRWAGSRAMQGRRRLLEEEEDEAYFDGPDEEEAGPPAPGPSVTTAADGGGDLLGGTPPPSLRRLGASDAVEDPVGSWPLGRQLPPRGGRGSGSGRSGEDSPRPGGGGGGGGGAAAASAAADASKGAALRLVDAYDSDGSDEEDDASAVSPAQSAVAHAAFAVADAAAARAIAAVNAAAARGAREAPEAAAGNAEEYPAAAAAAAGALVAAPASEAAMGDSAAAGAAELAGKEGAAGGGSDAARGVVRKAAYLAGEDTAVAAVTPLRPGTPPPGIIHSLHSPKLSGGSPGGGGGGGGSLAARAAAAVSAVADAAEAAADAAAGARAPAAKKPRQN